MVAFTAGGVGLMLAHHFFYTFLDQKPVDLASVGDDPLIPGLRSQSVVNAVGNLIAYLAKTCFAFAITTVSVQLFWMYLRQDALTIRQVDAAMSSVRSPSKSALSSLVSRAHSPASPAVRRIFFVSCLVASMAVISILAPGAIKTAVASFQIPGSCLVPNANITEWTGQLQPANPCPADVACRYNVAYLAPAFECKDITQGFDFTGFLEPFFVPNIFTNSIPENSFQVWNVTTLNTFPFVFQVLTCDMINGNKTTATECTAFDSTYSAVVSHFGGGVPSLVEVASITNKSVYYNLSEASPAMEERYLIMLDALDQLPLNVTATAGPDGTFLLTESSTTESFTTVGGIQSDVINTPLATLDTQNNIGWVNMTEALPSMLQNVSASLLSPELLSLSNGGDVSPSLSTTCFYTSTIWEYHRLRLLAPYAVSALLTTVCVGFGFAAVRRNGVEESLGFSRILAAVLNDDLFENRAALSGASKVQAQRSAMGTIIPGYL